MAGSSMRSSRRYRWCVLAHPMSKGRGALSSTRGSLRGRGLANDRTRSPAQACSPLQVLVSELGDETFIIAAILAMRHPRSLVFAGGIAALATMTVRPPTSRCHS